MSFYYSLFIDDERYPPNDSRNWIIARNWDEVYIAITLYGFPEYISFDHDLGENTCDGYEIAKKIVEIDMRQDVIPENFDFYVHSQNPVGKKNIEMYLKNYLKSKAITE